MDRFLHFDLSAWRCKKSLFLLACAYIFGLISGVLFSMPASGALASTMRAAIQSRVSIPGLLSAILLPLLFSAFAVYICRPQLLNLIAFCKAFAFAYLGTAVANAFGSAGWLVRFFLMFSDILLLPVLWWYWQKSLADSREFTRNTAIAAGLSLLVGSVDYCVISPFLADLIS